MLCSIFGHKYVDGFGKPFEIDTNLGTGVKAQAAISVLECTRCGKYSLIPSIKVNIVEVAESAIETVTKEKPSRGKKNEQ